VIGSRSRPDREDWLVRIPARFKDGKEGFDLRLAHDLGAVGVKAYTLSPLADRSVKESLPEAIPVFVDWLEHLDERIPDGRTLQEQLHKRAIWIGLMNNLYDPAAKGSQQVVAVLLNQFDKPNFHIEGHFPATRTLAYVATAKDFDRMVALFDKASDHDCARLPLVHYVGRFNTERSRGLLLSFITNDAELRWEAICALPRMKHREDIEMIEQYRGTTDVAGDKIIDAAVRKLRRVADG
jgi:hypothetical protein